MESSGWSRVRSIFSKALLLEQHERSVYVQEACAGDDELRDEVESLLSHHSEETEDGFLKPLALLNANKVEIATPRVRDIGSYQLLEKIGAGGMGEVFLARHKTMDRTVALKILPLHMVSSPAAIERFHREVRAAAKLEHPNIVTAYDAGEFDGVHFLVLQYVAGLDLASLLERQGRFPVKVAVACAIQTAIGLRYSHAQGVIHRDIKPSNLMATYTPNAAESTEFTDGTIKILDMGLALIQQAVPTKEESGARLTRSGDMMGTCDYLAPEQAANSRQTDGRADIYSLGCTLFRLIVGKPIYSCESFVETLLAHREAEIPSLATEFQDVSEKLATVFRKMVAKSADDRQASMDEVLSDLLLVTSDWRVESLGIEEWSQMTLAAYLDSLPADLLTPQRIPLRDSDTVGREREADQATRTRRDSVTAKANSPQRMKRMAVLAGAISLVFLFTAGALMSPLFSSKEPELLVGNRAQQQPEEQFATDKPALANSPFTASEATEYQQAWADYLGLPVNWENSVGMQFVLIPPGEFLMGSTVAQVEHSRADGEQAQLPEWFHDMLATECPQHRVRLTVPYYMSVHEVTHEQVELVKQQSSSDTIETPSESNSRYPVETFSFLEAREFCRQLSNLPEEQEFRYKYRLPSEAEWEFACRAGTTSLFSFGDDESDLGDYAWYNKNSGLAVHPVGTKFPNAFGLYDMHGNAKELCLDAFDREYYETGDWINPVNERPREFKRITRGGGNSKHVQICRSAFRHHEGETDKHCGLRIVRPIPISLVPFHTLAGHTEDRRVVAFSHDDSLLAVGYGGETTRLWDMSSGKIHKELQGHSGRTWAAAFSKDGNVFATGGSDQTIKIWRAPTFELVHTIETVSIVMDVDISPDGGTLVAAMQNGYVRQWDLSSWEMISSDKRHTGWAFGIDYSRDGKMFTSAGQGGVALFWRKDGKLERPIKDHLDGFIFLDSIFSPDDSTIAYSNQSGEIHLWNSETEQTDTIHAVSGPVHIRSLSFSPDGHVLAAINRHGFQLWEPGTHELLHERKTSTHGWSIAFSNDGSMLATTEGEEGIVRLWKVRMFDAEVNKPLVDER